MSPGHSNSWFKLKMFAKLLIGVCLLVLRSVDAGILMWGSQSIQVPSLKQFNNEDLELMKAYLRSPKIIAFHGDPTDISDKLQDLLNNKYTAYIPNSSVYIEDITELNGTPGQNYDRIEEKLEKANGENVLAVIVTSGVRSKREIDTTAEYESTESDYEPPSGPVLYAGESKIMEINLLVYSSKPPLLRSNTSSIFLGKATIGTVDNRPEKFSRLSVTIPVAEGKITLRFKFLWNGGYWTLNSVELVDTENKVYTLTLADDVTASRNFSYHCSGQTVFSDPDNEIELKLFDMQAQPDSSDGRFGGAYDCVSFTTAPIWSGLFVTFVLLLGLGIGLGALNSIKTMDKFDTAKTKQLSIQTSE